MGKLVGVAMLVAVCAGPVQAAPSNDTIAGATVVDRLPYTDQVEDPAQATREPDEPSSCLSPPNGVPQSYTSTVWYTFEPTQPGRYGLLAMQHDSLLVSSTHAGDGPSLALFRASAGTEEIDCARVYRDGAPARGTWIEADLLPGERYLIQVGCACLPSFLSELEFRMNSLAPNDLLANAIPVRGPAFSDQPFMGWASTDESDPRSCIAANDDVLLFGPTTTVWYAVSVPIDSSIAIRAARNHGGPAIGIFEATEGGLTDMACVVDRDGEDVRHAGFEAQAERTYLVQLIQQSDNTLDIRTDVQITGAAS